MPEPEGRRLRRALEVLVEEAQGAMDTLGIEPSERKPDPRRTLASWSSQWWSTVLDSRPVALRAYGAVDPATAEVLEPIVEALARRLLEVSSLASESTARR